MQLPSFFECIPICTVMRPIAPLAVAGCRLLPTYRNRCLEDGVRDGNSEPSIGAACEASGGCEQMMTPTGAGT